jgi:hypothetical protein
MPDAFNREGATSSPPVLEVASIELRAWLVASQIKFHWKIPVTATKALPTHRICARRCLRAVKGFSAISWQLCAQRTTCGAAGAELLTQASKICRHATAIWNISVSAAFCSAGQSTSLTLGLASHQVTTSTAQRRNCTVKLRRAPREVTAFICTVRVT